MTLRALLPILVGGLAVAGCGITDPYVHTARPANANPARSQSTATTTTTPADSRDPAPERGGTVPAAVQAIQQTLTDKSGALTARAALVRYVRLDINWQASTLAARQRELASISVNQARAAALQAAASAARDAELSHSQVANSGQIVAITPGTGPAANRWVIVTTETTAGQGDYAALPAGVHVTYARVTLTPTGWLVSQWSPQS